VTELCLVNFFNTNVAQGFSYRWSQLGLAYYQYLHYIAILCLEQRVTSTHLSCSVVWRGEAPALRGLLNVMLRLGVLNKTFVIQLMLMHWPKLESCISLLQTCQLSPDPRIKCGDSQSPVWFSFSFPSSSYLCNITLLFVIVPLQNCNYFLQGKITSPNKWWRGLSHVQNEWRSCCSNLRNTSAWRWNCLKRGGKLEFSHSTEGFLYFPSPHNTI
jgi:hypothetical protein